MNLDDWQHPIITLIVCAILCLFSAQPMTYFAPVVFFLGREHAQAEYRWIEQFGSHRRSQLPWWGGFDPRIWDTHSWLWNLLMPCGVSAVFVIQAHFAWLQPDWLFSLRF